MYEITTITLSYIFTARVRVLLQAYQRPE